MQNKLQHDDQGFLVGVGPVKASREESFLLRQIADDVRAIRQAMGARSSQRERQLRDAADSPAPSAKRPSNVVALPVRSDRSAGARPSVVGAKPTGSKIADSVGSTKAVTPNRSAGDSVRSLSDAIAARLPKTGRTGSAGSVSMVATPRMRDDKGRFIPAEKASKEAAKSAREVKRAVESKDIGVRDGKGRFTGSGSDAGDSRVLQTIESIGDKIGSLAIGNNEATEIDPTIKAATDIAGLAARSVKGVAGVTMQIAKPLGRGVSKLFGGKASDAPTPWFRRFFAEMRLFRREQSVFNKTELRVLKEIERKPIGGGGGGMFGLLGGLLASFVGMIVAAIAKGFGDGFGLLSKLPLFKMLPGLKPGLPTNRVPSSAPDVPGSPDGKGKGGRLGKLARGAGGLLKRVPLLGAGLAAIGMGSAIYESESDESLTREEKDKQTGKAVGAGAGAIGGMLGGGASGAKLGAALGIIGGPFGVAIGAGIGGLVGAAAGGFFGEKAGAVIGNTVGGWVTDLRNADIPGLIGVAWTTTSDAVSTAWTDTTAWIQKQWGGALETFSGVWTKAKVVFDSLSVGFTEVLGKLGIDVPAIQKTIGETADRVGGAVAKTYDQTKTAVVEGAKAAGAAIGDTYKQAKTTVTEGAKAAGQAVGNAADTVGKEIKNSMVGKGAAKLSQKAVSAWGDAKQYLVGASNQAGVDPGIVAKIGAFESSFDSTIRPKRKDGSLISSAHGYGQFLDGTWTDMLNRHGAKYGVQGAGKLTKDQAGKLRNDKALQAQMLAEFTKENIAKGRKYGGKDDDANVYAFHNLGDGDAKKLLKGMGENPAMSVRDALMQGAKTDKERARVEAVISGNQSLYGNGSISVSEAYGRMGDVMRRGEAFAHDARGAVARAGVPATSAAMVSATTAPNIKSAPTVALPTVGEAPAVDQSAAASRMNVSGKPVAVSAGEKSRKVGRDLADRKIAHIVTGGISA